MKYHSIKKINRMILKGILYMLQIKRNEISFNIKDYVHLIMGSKKIGKSTLFSEIGRTEYGLDKTLCISMGDEDGHQVLCYKSDKIYVVSTTELSDFQFELVDLADKTPIPATTFSTDTSENKSENGAYTNFDSLTLSGTLYGDTLTIKNNFNVTFI